ncbi:MAG: hypothetical protein JXQ83_00030 [Candidatus Glassbacteria bacterium]|nr:hypothetical protein [Candidatus Glassbacteria bacterium]
MINYLPLLVVAVLIVVIYLKLKKQRQLLEKANKYEKLLRDSRISRYKYQQTLQRSRDFFKSQEQVNESLRIIKAELGSIRSDMRSHLEGIRHEVKKSDNTEFDKKVIGQMKTALEQKWKFFNSRKIECNKVVDKVNGLEVEKNEIINAERAACDKWTREKETVLKLWRELNTQIKITNPQKFYG